MILPHLSFLFKIWPSLIKTKRAARTNGLPYDYYFNTASGLISEPF